MTEQGLLRLRELEEENQRLRGTIPAGCPEIFLTVFAGRLTGIHADRKNSRIRLRICCFFLVIKDTYNCVNC